MPIEMYFNKASFYLRPFNTQLQKFASNGLLQHWIDKYRHVEYRRTVSEKLPAVLTYQQLEGIFYICGALYVMAIVVFILEIIIANTV